MNRGGAGPEHASDTLLGDGMISRLCVTASLTTYRQDAPSTDVRLVLDWPQSCTAVMPPRSSSSKSSGRGFQPAHDSPTYRDRLLFENRLKTNVSSLNRRKHRYQRAS